MANTNYTRVDNLPVGSQIIFGKNKFINKYHDGEEEIVWVVVANNHYENDTGYPIDGVTLITRDVLRYMAFDAKEPSNANVDRAAWGNSRYRTSNIRQWLNSDGYAGMWYSPQNLSSPSNKDNKDTPPTVENLLNVSRNYPYNADEGFLRFFTETERNALLPTTIKTIIPLESGDANPSVPEVEMTTDYFYLPSLIEITGTTFSYGATAPSEGGKILSDGSPFGNAIASSLTLINGAKYSENANLNKDYIYRSPAMNSEILKYIDNGGAGTFGRVKPFDSHGIRPMTNIKGDTIVVTDENNVYRLIDNAKPYVVIDSVNNFELKFRAFDYDDILSTIKIEINGQQIHTYNMTNNINEYSGEYQIPFNRLSFGQNTLVIRVVDSRGLIGIKTLNVQLNHKDLIISGDSIATRDGNYQVQSATTDSNGRTLLTLDKNLKSTVLMSDICETIKIHHKVHTILNDSQVELPVYEPMTLKSIEYNKQDMTAIEGWEGTSFGSYCHTKIEMNRGNNISLETELSKISQIFTYYED